MANSIVEESNILKQNKVAHSLKVIANKLSGCGISWIIGGSSSLLIHGLNVVPNDIDIIVEPKDFESILKVLREYVVDEDNTTKHANFRVDGVNGEILSMTIYKNEVVEKNFKDVVIPVNDLIFEYKYYLKCSFKSESTIEKIKMIEDYLNINKK